MSWLLLRLVISTHVLNMKFILTTFLSKIQLFLDVTLCPQVTGSWHSDRPSGNVCPAIKCHIPEDFDYPEILLWGSKISQLLMPWIWHSTPQLTFYFKLKPHLWNVPAHSSHHSLCASHPKLQLMTVYFSHLSDMFKCVWRFTTLNWDPPPTVLMPVLRMKQMQPDKTCSSLQLAFCRHTHQYKLAASRICNAKKNKEQSE